eukprot:CAMPEP_0118711684 /NCGR_PEP_ID=MMETSP0800-20121206/24260_1 /TAXON_ID=210618 ORGANISM="Striatella unipunctata, Strain CCMP2910" /NCGR_SAMPLE_ID=MMETSP0800 /ASSEMBLY_ACC=CAM_ASM_000638 /LENGTH=254 /DNA_ID=CAMNT_0006616377 /DNA_START=90 /DNA_END=851 /DNA_ORIENTATION=+
MKSRRLWQKALAPNAPRSAMLKAILYEIQPVRISTLRNGPAWVKEQASSAHGIYREIADEVKILLNHEDLKDYMREKTIKWKQHMPWFAIFMMYAWAVWTVHKWLDAGPMMVIVTLLVMIFTVGLGDRKGDGVMSAYSVFNRGFQRLLGTVDAEDLVAEQVGGVMAAQARANNPQQQQQQQAAEPGQQQQQPPNQQQGRARRSGKKARRRDLQARRERQMQQQAAMDMGFEGDDMQEAQAMQQLLEEQIMQMRE